MIKSILIKATIEGSGIINFDSNDHGSFGIVSVILRMSDIRTFHLARVVTIR